MEDKSIADLEHEKVILELWLLRINQEIARRKDKSRSVLDLKDESGNHICIGDRVKLLSKGSKSLPFRGVEEAVVIGTAHQGIQIKVGLIKNPSVYTDSISSNLEVI